MRTVAEGCWAIIGWRVMRAVVASGADMRQFERLRVSADRASECLKNLGESERARKEPPLEELEEVEGP